MVNGNSAPSGQDQPTVSLFTPQKDMLLPLVQIVFSLGRPLISSTQKQGLIQSSPVSSGCWTKLPLYPDHSFIPTISCFIEKLLSVPVHPFGSQIISKPFLELMLLVLPIQTPLPYLNENPFTPFAPLDDTGPQLPVLSLGRGLSPKSHYICILSDIPDSG